MCPFLSGKLLSNRRPLLQSPQSGFVGKERICPFGMVRAGGWGNAGFILPGAVGGVCRERKQSWLPSG